MRREMRHMQKFERHVSSIVAERGLEGEDGRGTECLRDLETSIP